MKKIYCIEICKTEMTYLCMHTGTQDQTQKTEQVTQKIRKNKYFSNRLKPIMVIGMPKNMIFSNILHKQIRKQDTQLTCPFRMKASFNFRFSNCSPCLFLVTVSRRSEIVINAFQRFFWQKSTVQFKKSKCQDDQIRERKTFLNPRYKMYIILI